ncbi:MAG: multidrug efflux MFS transporter [Alcanivorax sp.]|nr:multidrug efflux MFS transporter [Alcanivorax sp.]
MPTIEQLFERHGPRYRWLATATVMLGTLSMVLTSTIINVAVPAIMGEFHLGQDQVHWLSTAFLAAMTVGMLVNAWCLARFGSRRTFLCAMTIFIVASVMGGFSQNFEVLVAVRAVQGVMAGLIQPHALVTIFQVFPWNKRGQAMGIYGMGVVLGPAVAPALGGILVDTLSWRAVFFAVLPSCLLALFMASRFLPGTAHARNHRLDWLGMILLGGGLTALLWALAGLARRGLDDPLLLTALFGGPLLMGAFAAWQFRHPYPLFDPRVFRYPGFAGGFFVAMVMGAGVFGSTYLMPLYFQQVQGMTATDAGFILIPAGIAMAVIFPVSGHLSDRLPGAVMIGSGLLLMPLSLLCLRAADIGTGVVWLMLWVALGRVALGLMMPPVNTGSLALLPPEMIPQGSGVVNFARQIGGALGVNLSAICVQFFSDRHWQAHPEAGHPHAFEVGFDDAFLITASLFILALWPLARMSRGQRLKRTETS